MAFLRLTPVKPNTPYRQSQRISCWALEPWESISHKNHHTKSFSIKENPMSTVDSPLKTLPKNKHQPKYLNPSITSHPAKSSFDSFIVLKDHAARWEGMSCLGCLNKLWFMGPDKVFFLFAAACGIRQRLPKDTWHATSLKRKCNRTTVVVCAYRKKAAKCGHPNFKGSQAYQLGVGKHSFKMF